jgi:hypothetical protein
MAKGDRGIGYILGIEEQAGKNARQGLNAGPTRGNANTTGSGDRERFPDEHASRPGRGNGNGSSGERERCEPGIQEQIFGVSRTPTPGSTMILHTFFGL